MRKFIGITVGPVIDTLMLTATPAGMWAASYTFSLVTKKICEKLCSGEYGFSMKDSDILSPYFIYDPKGNEEKAKEYVARVDGLGLYHDRIICRKPPGFSMEELNKLFGDVKDDIAYLYTKDANPSAPEEENVRKYFKDYLRIFALEFPCSEEKSPIMASAEFLDAIELQTTFVQKQRENYILSVFDNRETTANKIESKNIRIRDGKLVKPLKKWQLFNKKNGSIRTLEDLARADVQDKNMMKKHKYFAIVVADADHMTDILKHIGAGNLRAFSETCMEFAVAASQLVEGHGGMTIYAGGDDLLFIAPVENDDGNTIFHLVKDIDKQFNESFNQLFNELPETKCGTSKRPTLSLGVFVCYYKHPLYDALAQARHLLFDVAKRHNYNRKTADYEKNAIAFALQKNAGAKDACVFGKADGLKGLNEMLMLLERPKNEPDKFLRSVQQKIMEYSNLYCVAIEKKSDDALKALFANLFNEPIHAQEHNVAFIERVEKLMWDIRHGTLHVVPLEEQEYPKLNNTILASSAMLRILAFFYEEAGKEA